MKNKLAKLESKKRAKFNFYLVIEHYFEYISLKNICKCILLL